MSIPRRRWLEKFTDAGGANAYEFPHFNYEWEPAQALQTAVAPVAGASYGLNQLGRTTLPKAPGVERVRFLIMHSDDATIDEQVDNLKGTFYRNATGRLWSIDESGSRRWARAMAVTMPDMTFISSQRAFVPVAIEFMRLSDWYAETQTVVTEEVTATPTSIVVANDGAADIGNAVVELRANAAGGFQALTFENLSTGDSFSSSRVAESSSSRLKIDAGKHIVQYSNDAGVTWDNDYPNFTWGAQQVDFLKLVAGSNNLRYSQSTGTPNLDIVISFYAAWN